MEFILLMEITLWVNVNEFIVTFSKFISPPIHTEQNSLEICLKPGVVSSISCFNATMLKWFWIGTEGNKFYQFLRVCVCWYLCKFFDVQKRQHRIHNYETMAILVSWCDHDTNRYIIRSYCITWNNHQKTYLNCPKE